MSEASHLPDRQALAERSRLFLRHERMLRSFLHALVPSAADVDDLVQEVGVRILADLESVVPEDKFAAWTRGIARNLVLHYWRARQHAPQPLAERYIDAVSRAFDDSPEDEERWNARDRALAECFDALPERSRELLRDRYVRKLRSEQIAMRDNRSAVAIRRALMRIRRALLRCIERRLAPVTEGRS